MSFNIQEYPKLKEAIEKNNLVVFVGAGTSINLKNIKGEAIGNWSKLVEKTLYHLNEKNSNKFKNLLPLLKEYDPIDILNLIEKNRDLDKRDVYDFLKDFLDLGDNDFTIHKKIIQLSKLIITTNYDTSFETCDKELSKRVAYKGKNFELTTHKDSDKPLLFKLHGCFEDASSMVLFPSNYNELYNNDNRDAQHALSAFKNLVYNKSILFIGFGMGDFQINNIFKEVKKILGEFNEHHFIISKTRPDSTLNFLTHIEINKHEELEEVVDSLNEFRDAILKGKNKEKEEQQKQIEALSIKLKENKSKNEKLIEELFQEALDFGDNGEYQNEIKKYSQISYLEQYSGIYYNWGLSLDNFSKTKEGDEKSALLEECCEKYKIANEIDENDTSIYINWGVSLGNLAESKIEREEKLKLWKLSSEKFKSAIDIDENDASSFYGYGNSIFSLGKINSGKQRDELFDKAEKIFFKAINLGGSTYNLACLYSLKNNKELALENLQLALQNNRITPHFTLNDPDWISFKNDKDFISLLEKYKSN